MVNNGKKFNRILLKIIFLNFYTYICLEQMYIIYKLLNIYF